MQVGIDDIIKRLKKKCINCRVEKRNTKITNTYSDYLNTMFQYKQIAQIGFR